MKQCTECNAELGNVHWNTKFCKLCLGSSDRLKDAAAARRFYEKNRMCKKPLRTISCETCGTEIQAASGPRRFCYDCAESRSRVRSRIKGRESYVPWPQRIIKCSACGVDVYCGKKSSMQKYCIKCSKEERRRRTNELDRAKRLDPDREAIIERRRKQALAYQRSERGFAGYLRRNYGIGVNEYKEAYERQGGVCAVRGCGSNGKVGKHKKLVVDHCHVTGKFRGLLCNLCNAALGMTKENKGRLAGLAEYLNSISVPANQSGWDMNYELLAMDCGFQ